ncbi:hypothetical protein AWB78_07344 [Caballeronia calidae]|uniref:Uncharacterized protein n=1 Tax=Caballeronia calidae TaxID=1777139 RepID=A0A158EE60_9BURK|nr:hypothetical protein AWB78_07344 [Caballeronia calidae]
MAASGVGRGLLNVRTYKSRADCFWPASARSPTNRRSDFGLLSHLERVVDFNAQLAHCALQFGMCKEQLNCAQIFRSPIDQRSFGTAHRVSPIRRVVEPNRCNPAVNIPRVLPCRQMRRGTQPTWEQVIDGFQSSCRDPGRDAMQCLFRDFELNRTSGFLLHERCPRNDVAAHAYVLHLQSRQIARSEFAVDRQVEHCQITNVRRHLQARPNSPNRDRCRLFSIQIVGGSFDIGVTTSLEMTECSQPNKKEKHLHVVATGFLYC